MLTIKVLGSGCPNCQRLTQEVQQALAGSPLETQYELIKVTDYADIAAYGIMRTPGLVINETVVAAGRIPPRDQILTWATQAN
jgi:small redox-active disulfide protein 2